MWIPRLFTVLVIYFTIIAALIITKPALMFNPDGKPKEFGLGLTTGRSVAAPCIMFPLLGLITYIFVIWMKVMLRA